MDTSCTKHWWNEEVNSVDIIEGLSLILTSGLIEFDQYGVPSISSGVREARVMIADVLTTFVVHKLKGERIHGWASCFSRTAEYHERRSMDTEDIDDGGREGRRGQDEVGRTVETFACAHRRMLTQASY
jgi:hypothetical protein